MNELKVNNLTKLAAQLPQHAEISKNAQAHIKGGCGGRQRGSTRTPCQTPPTPCTPTPVVQLPPPAIDNGNVG